MLGSSKKIYVYILYLVPIQPCIAFRFTKFLCFLLNMPQGKFSLVVAISDVCVYVFMLSRPQFYVWGLSLANIDHMITSLASH